MAVLGFQQPFVENFLSPTELLWNLFVINCSLLMCVSISGLGILSHWNAWLRVPQYHNVLVTIALWWVLESGSVNLRTLIFFNNSEFSGPRTQSTSPFVKGLFLSNVLSFSVYSSCNPLSNLSQIISYFSMVFLITRFLRIWY